MASIKNRVRRLQRRRQSKMVATQLYECRVDGEPMQLDVLEIAYLREAEKRTVEVGAVCGMRFTQAAAYPDFAALDQAFAAAANMTTEMS